MSHTLKHLQSQRSTLAVAILLFAGSLQAQNIVIQNQSVNEGDVGTVNMDFPITINPVSAMPITLNYSTGAVGTATAGSDYTAVTNASITIPANTASAIARVVVLSERLVEAQESFTVTINNNSAGTIVTNQALGQINNDDQSVLSIASVAQAEGNTAGTLSFTASLSNPVQGAVSANVSSTDGTAVAPSDYTALNQTLNFASAVTSQSFTVTTVGDTIVEADERFSLSLGSLNVPAALVGSISLSAAPISGTLNNDDSATLSLNSQGQAEGNVGNTPMSFTATLSNPVQGGISATANTSDGNNANALLNATVADLDYVALVNAPISIAGTTQNLAVQIVGDTDVEPNQSFRLTLSNVVLPAGVASSALTIAAPGVGTINNDDATGISITSASLIEGNAATSSMTFALTLSSTNKDPVSVSFSTGGGTATPGTDYTQSTGTAIFAPNTLTQSITVPIRGDLALENTETFTLSLSNPIGASIATPSAIGTITNDDSVTLGINDVATGEPNGTLSFAVTLTGSSEIPVAVNFATENGTALAPQDYLASSGILTFAPGVSSLSLPVTLINDSLIEDTETFGMRLSNPQPAAPSVLLNPTLGTGSILNDDFPIQVSTLDWRGMLMMSLLLLGIAGMAIRRVR